MNQIFPIFDISIEFSKENILKKLQTSIQKDYKGYVCTINANLIAETFHNNEYKQILQNSYINICDGSVLAFCIGLIYKVKLKSWPGPDFFIKAVQVKEFRHFFLGNYQETLNRLKNTLITINTNLGKSVFQPLPNLESEYFDYRTISKLINQNKPDIIWVSLGAPKQEIFASRLIPYINKGLIVCIGAAFDFYCDIKRQGRAPVFIRRIKLEWLWRLYKTPRKTIKRLYREFVILPRILLLEWVKVRKSQE